MLETSEERSQVTVEELQALTEAFEHFTRQTDQLREAYGQLKDEAERVDLELEKANLALQQKVRELDEANNFQRSILESIPIAVVVTDLDGAILTFNPAAEKMWGCSRQQAIGRDFRDVMKPHDALLAGVIERRYRQETLRREVGEGETRIISSTACLVEDSSSRPIGATQLDRDITRECELESQLRQQEKLADLGRMAAGLAHEIRKPLNGIKGFASILERRSEADGRQHRYIENIIGAADRLNGMLSRLLDFARPDTLQAGPCDLRSEAEQICEFVRAEHSFERGEIVVDIPDEACWVVADRSKIKQVILNLVTNGVEALEGPGEVRVTACLEADNERLVRMMVSDTGRGIAKDKVGKILEPFYTEKKGGTGLGLAIVSRILQLHGSELLIDSEPGRGTTMQFRLAAYVKTEER